MTIQVAGDTHKGLVRKNNEDNFSILKLEPDLYLLLVADGVGGQNYGEEASRIAVETFADLAQQGKLATLRKPVMREPLLRMAVQRAHTLIGRQALSDDKYRGCSCTLTAVVVDPLSACLLQVGDSRLYHSSGGHLTQISEDQTRARDLFHGGRIAEQDIAEHPDRNVLMQALGVESSKQPLAPVFTALNWVPGERLLLCSDGLSDMLSQQQLAEQLGRTGEAAAGVQSLIDSALAAGGRDNITLVLAYNSE